MNPFNLYGPQFLIFYALFAIATLAMLYVIRSLRESENDAIVPRPRDPYLLACLRGGPKEVVRVATISLIDRKLIRTSGDTGISAANSADGETRVERALLDHFRIASSISDAVGRSSIVDIARDDYEQRLRRDRLIPDSAAYGFRFLLLLVALAALGIVGGAKIMIALDRGRTNIGFLIVMMVVAAIAALAITFRYRTSKGDDYLAGIRSLFSHLRQRAASVRPGGASKDLLWLTSIFGVGALSTATFPFIAYVRPKDSGSGGCGGGSSGCGGGGGGGCGGCGS
jgi:uncharacterized protein (TIGR04222 family)